MHLQKIHKVMSFTQSPWMRPYIELCVERRKAASTNFQKDFWKLLMNAVFGKSMENVRKRIRVEMVTSQVKAMKLTAKNTFKRAVVFNDNLTTIELYKTKVCLNKPLYIGQAILDLSKIYMYDFHYNYIHRKYGDYKLLFSDTDSFCYFFKAPNIYEDMKEHRELYDFLKLSIISSTFSPTQIRR